MADIDTRAKQIDVLLNMESFSDAMDDWCDTVLNITETMLDFMDACVPSRTRALYNATDFFWQPEGWRTLVMAWKYPKRKRRKMRADLEAARHIRFFSTMKREWAREKARKAWYEKRLFGHTARGIDRADTHG